MRYAMCTAYSVISKSSISTVPIFSVFHLHAFVLIGVLCSPGQLAAAGVAHRDADHAGSHLGRAVGITTLLRGTAAHAAARRCYLPVDLCAEARVSQEDVYAGVVSEGLRDVVHKVASLAKGHLDEARKLAPRLPPSAAGVMLPAVAVGRYLEALEARNFDPYDARLIRDHGGAGSAPLSYVFAVKWHQWRGTY